MNQNLQASELILNSDNSIYHLRLQPHQIAHDIILVGDQNRVETISSFFSQIEHKVSNREFVCHTGVFNNKKISTISTGIGTDNIDIVLNELDALVNIDLEKKTIKDKHTKLRLVRIGTSGALQKNIDIDSFVLSQYAFGLDNLIYYYKNFETILAQDLIHEFEKKSNVWIPNVKPYAVAANEGLIKILEHHTHKGITLTAPGFYAPQGRVLRNELSMNDYHKNLALFEFENLKLSNFEMETSALYGLSKLLGHDAATVCVIVANRASKQFSKDYHPPMKKLILKVLENLTQ